MAPRRGITLTLEHQRRVRDGEITLAGLADELGVSRQSLHQAFRRRPGWGTTPAVDNKPQHRDLPGVDGDGEEPSDGDQLGVGVEAAARHAGRRSAPTAPSPLPASLSSARSAPGAPGIPIYWTDREDLANLVQHEALNVAILLLTRTRDALASGQIMSMNAVKAAASASTLAMEQLRALGLVVDPDIAGPQKLVIQEMTASEVAEVQRQAEAEHLGVVNDIDA